MEYKRRINTPCVTICTLDSSEEYCIGCGRKIKEIEDWYFMDDEEKLKILKQLDNRKNKLVR
jgi:predicted Fe-S protein YdhL (DUF1289 family)